MSGLLCTVQVWQNEKRIGQWTVRTNSAPTLGAPIRRKVDVFVRSQVEMGHMVPGEYEMVLVVDSTGKEAQRLKANV